MLYAVIMAGGKGERFWPKSREKMPKQLLSLLNLSSKGGLSMIQTTVNRIQSIVSEDNIFVVANKKQNSMIRKQLIGLKNLPNIKSSNILIEPIGRNTAPCIGLAAIYLKRKDPEGIMVVLPSDHLIIGRRQFLEAILTSERIAQVENSLVTIGINPTYPATGYGYINAVDSSQFTVYSKKQKIYKVREFIEKPDRKTAEIFLKNGEYFWNSGIFIWKVATILDNIKKYMPKLYSNLRKIEKVIGTKDYETYLSKIYFGLDKISIDCGIMEKAKNVFMVNADFLWDDVGSWGAMERIVSKDGNGNVVLGQYEGINTKDSIIVSEDGCMVGTIGISNLIIVQTKDATLVCHKDRAEDVKKLVEKLGRNDKFKKYI